MKQKMKKCLCLMLSFIFVLSNCVQLFAQEVTIESTIPYEEMKQLEQEFKEVRNMLDDFRVQIRQLKYQETMILSPKGNIMHRAGPALERTAEVEKNFISLLKKVDGFDKYVATQKQVPTLERLAYKYNAQKPKMFFEGTFLEEGAAFTKISYGVNELNKLATTEGVIDKTIIEAGVKKEEMFENVFNYLYSRLDLAENQALKVAEANNELYMQTMKMVKIAGITNEDIVKEAIKTISEEDLKLIGFVKRIKDGEKVNPINLAIAIKRQLKFVGAKKQPSLLKLIHKVAHDSYYKTLYKNHPELMMVDPAKYEQLIEEFPILKNGKYVTPKYTIRKLFRATPFIVIGIVLTAVTITEISSNNNFNENTVGVREMRALRNKVEQGDASFMEAMLYYTDRRNERELLNNPRHTTNLINMAVAMNNADKDFDVIQKYLEEEYDYRAQAEADVINTFDEYYNSAIQKVGEGMI